MILLAIETLKCHWCVSDRTYKAWRNSEQIIIIIIIIIIIRPRIQKTEHRETRSSVFSFELMKISPVALLKILLAYLVCGW